MKKLTNIGGYPNIQTFVRAKIARYKKQEKNFRTLFEMMFSEKENVMAEITDGYRIKKLTYGQFRQWILEVVPSVRQALGDPERDSLVGIYMNNSMQWLVTFWAVLLCGCRPLLMNTRLDDGLLEQLLQDHKVCAVISDGKLFSVKTLIAQTVLVRGAPETEPEVFGSEVVFMSSGTTEQVKLCAYTGENFYYQVLCSIDIVDRCPDIAAHYQGELRQLALLPFYHVFGFIAVYLWFGFFGRTFVFLKDMNPSTILSTVRKHRVTHIFAVPLVWDSVYREANRKIRERGPKTYARFQKAMELCNRTGKLGDRLAARLLGDVREAIFGDSVQFMITGGSGIEPEVVAFFNGIGYTLVNGYGMTEVGITSVEMSMKKQQRNLASVGMPFSCVDYRISPEGELLIRSKARAARIITAGAVTETDYDAWFCSHDMAKQVGGRYYLQGRADDLIVCENGENINPVLVESKLKVEGVQSLCLFDSPQEGPVLLASAPDCGNDEMLWAITEALRQALWVANLADLVKKVAVTAMPIMDASEFKISRKKVAKKYARGEFFLLTPDTMALHRQQVLSRREHQVRACFAQALNQPEEQIGVLDDFFTDLGGTSLDYFMLKDLLTQRFGVQIEEDAQGLTTVSAFCGYITDRKR